MAANPILIDGQTYTPEQIAQIVKQNQRYHEVVSDPAQRQMFIKNLQTMPGAEPAPVDPLGSIDTDSLSAEGVQLLSAFRSVVQQQQETIQALHAQVAGIAPVVQGVSAQQHLNDAVRRVASETNVALTAEQVAQVMQAKGIDDPYAAGLIASAAVPKVETPPPGPGASGANVFVAYLDTDPVRVGLAAQNGLEIQYVDTKEPVASPEGTPETTPPPAA